jgi:hypothetical protein
MTKELKTYDIKLYPDPSMPDGVWDPKWNEPEVAIRVAINTYKSLRFQELNFELSSLTPVEDLPLDDFDQRLAERRNFILPDPIALEDLGNQFRGGSFGELFKRYSFGIATIYFHAQAVNFGFDNEGRFMFHARVGRINGTWGKKAALSVSFNTPEGSIGSIGWAGELDPPRDIDVIIVGQDPQISAKFEAITDVDVAFFTYCIDP